MQINESLQLTPTAASGHQSMLDHVNCAYTTLRTVARRGVFKLDEHVRRLHTAFQTKSKIPGPSFDRIKELVVQHMQMYLCNVFPDQELCCHFFLSYETTALTSHCEPLRVHPQIAKMEIAEITRSDPSIKDSVWVHKRRQVEGMIDDQIDEVIIYNDEGLVTEGLSSNVFAVMADGTIRTAPLPMVLDGTVRQIIMEICRQLGHKVVEECITYRQMLSPEVREIFVSSTSRYVVVGSHVHGIQKETAVGLAIRQRVVERVTEESTVVV